MTRGIEIRPVSIARQRDALRRTIATPDQSDADVELHVSAFLEYARTLSTDIRGQWLAADHGRIIGACTCAIAPGRTAVLILPSPRRMPVPEDVASQLVDAATLHARNAGVRLLQCLIAPDDLEIVQTLRRLGWTRVADLQYMEAPTDSPGRVEMPRHARLDWRAYDETTHDQFAATIEATYEASMDCPALAGMREMHDVIVGHRAAAVFRPSRWRLLCEDGRPIGCILIGDNPLRPTAELIYMGVQPDQRGRGWGAVLLRDAFKAACRDGLRQMTLAVDTNNVPALRLYHRFGFRSTMQRTAMVTRV